MRTASLSLARTLTPLRPVPRPTLRARRRSALRGFVLVALIVGAIVWALTGELPL